MSLSKPVVKTYQFSWNQDINYLKSFPIVKLDAKRVSISIYGVVLSCNKVLLQGDYTEYIHAGREGILQPDGRFVFPFLALKWIPEDKKHHQYLCFVYNLYDAEGKFLSHKRCDSLIALERQEQPSISSPSQGETRAMQSKLQNLSLDKRAREEPPAEEPRESPLEESCRGTLAQDMSKPAKVSKNNNIPCFTKSASLDSGMAIASKPVIEAAPSKRTTASQTYAL